MPTKTERILSYLPGTFRRLPQLSPLLATVDAFGSELLKGENSLAAIMQSHWVDHADRGAETIHDLALIAAMYGLSPREDETVEEFREHLKRYVRTFLEGTVTVQGILRVAAEALALRIADDYADIDTWWTRKRPAALEEAPLVTTEARGDDAARLLFGTTIATAYGAPALPAQVVGTVNLSGEVQLPAGATLTIKVNTDGPVTVKLVEGIGPARLTLSDLVEKIDTQLGAQVASHDGRYLALHSTTNGKTSKLEIEDGPGDVAEELLGLARRSYRGSDAAEAHVTGTIEHNGIVDLSEERYIRLLVDGTTLAEIDCAGLDATETTLDQVRAAINLALGMNIARHDGHFITLASPTTGFNSTIAFQASAAQDAAQRLFGPVAPVYTGRDAQPARAKSSHDLGAGIDLSEQTRLFLNIDGTSKTIDVAGGDPANTQIGEIVEAINDAFGATIASHDGRFITLTSTKSGTAGQIIFEPPKRARDAARDATELIFGIPTRRFEGSAAEAARIQGSADLSGGANLMAQRLLQLAVDGGAPVQIDLYKAVADPKSVSLDQIKTVINATLGKEVANHDGQYLVLVSPTAGAASSLALLPLERIQQRRFASRARIIDEAAQTMFGFVALEASGAAATRARLVGTADLSRGVDLRNGQYIRLSIDGHPAIDIDCAGARVRATLLDEVVKKINNGLKTIDERFANVATDDEEHLGLTSPLAGADSRIAFEPPRALDALSKLLGVEPLTARGQDASKVRFVGTRDMREGTDLSSANKLRIGVDGASLVDISIAGANPSQTTPAEIANAINQALGVTVASVVSGHIVLTSPKTGAESQLSFAAPTDSDATQAIFGIAAPRAYRGANAQPARIVGTVDLSGNVDLRTARFLWLSIDGGQTLEIDCAGGSSDPAAAQLDDIVKTINGVAQVEIASKDGGRLVLRSSRVGVSATLRLEAYTAGDAFQMLLGQAERAIQGKDPQPAVITGQVDMARPLNLQKRQVIRLAVDGGRPTDIPIEAARLERVSPVEILASINAVFPGLASLTDEGRIRLTSPTAGESSQLSLMPLRYLEVIEYTPAEEPAEATHTVRHGDAMTIDNMGAGDSNADVLVTAPRGATGVSLVNTALGWRVQLLTSLRPVDSARIWLDPQGRLRAAIHAPDGSGTPISGAKIIAGPIGGQVVVPFEDSWPLHASSLETATVHLNNPLALSIVQLRTRSTVEPDQIIAVTVQESDLISVSEPSAVASAGQTPTRLIGRIQADAKGYRLVDAAKNRIAQLRTGPSVNLAAHEKRTVAVTGWFYNGNGNGTTPVMVVWQIDDLFDVTLQLERPGGGLIEEIYAGVTIGGDAGSPYSLVWQVNTGASQLVQADAYEKREVLSLPRGQTIWRYMECDAWRFNQDRYASRKDSPSDPKKAHYAGDVCLEYGVFNASRFLNIRSNETPPADTLPIYAPTRPLPDPEVTVRFTWTHHLQGTLSVNLPADLPARFGGRFNDARFGQGENAPELYSQVVTDPPEDARYLVKLIEASKLVRAGIVASVPLGFRAAAMPFRKPHYLSGGREGETARLYLAEEGLNNQFIELAAKEAGAWGNEIAMSARGSGPAMYDVEIVYKGARFESARKIVMGKDLRDPDLDLPAQVSELLKPGPVGLLQAKAGGVKVAVTRDRA